MQRSSYTTNTSAMCEAASAPGAIPVCLTHASMSNNPSASSSGQPAPKRFQGAPGGHAQKRKWAAETSDSPNVQSELVSLLLKKWAWGQATAPFIQQVCECAVKDGLVHPKVRELASMGSHGMYPNNCHAELTRKLPTSPMMSALSTISLSFKKSAMCISHGQHAILLPHQVFACIWEHHREEFVRRLCGGDYNNIKKFWKGMRTHPAYGDHPVASRPDRDTHCIPISMHGDGVAVSGISRAWAKSVDAYSWNSLLSQGSTTDMNFLIFIYYPKLVIEHEAMNAHALFFKKLAWSLYWLLLGRWPLRDENNRAYTAADPEYQKAGRPLASGFYGCLWTLRADLEHMFKQFGFPAACGSSTNPCGLCECNKSDKPWTDGRAEAAWRITVHSNQSWKASHPAANPIFQLPGVGILCFMPDAMHTLHLGCYQWFLGSVIKYLVDFAMPESKEANLDTLVKHIKGYYKEHGATITTCNIFIQTTTQVITMIL